MKELHYGMIAQWDEDDKIFVVSMPELPGCGTYGEIYKKAVKQAQYAIEGWMKFAKEQGWQIPALKVAVYD